MRSGKWTARNLTNVAVVSLLLTMNCWAQKPQETQSAVPLLPADIPGTADRYSVLAAPTAADRLAALSEAVDSVAAVIEFQLPQ